MSKTKVTLIVCAMVMGASLFFAGRASVRARVVERKVIVTAEKTEATRAAAYVGRVDTREVARVRWKVKTITRADGSSERVEVGEVNQEKNAAAAESSEVLTKETAERTTKAETVREVDRGRANWLASGWVRVDREYSRTYAASLSRRIVGPVFVGLSVQRSPEWSGGVGLSIEW